MLVGFVLSLATILKNENGSFEVTTAMVDMFSSNVMHLSQQNGSRLEKYCRKETQSAESKFYDRIGLRTARRKEGRHSRVVHTDTPHSRRMVTLEEWYDSDVVDEEDKIRLIMNPQSEYAQAIGKSLGRQKDETIIDFALGNAYGGKKGATAVPLPNTQKIAAHDGATTTGVGLNVRTLRAVKKKFTQNEASDPNESLCFACAAQQIDDLLGETEVTSSDFAVIQALVKGNVNAFMGFEFEQLELLPFTSAATTYSLTDGSVGAGAGTVTLGEGRRCIAFTKNRGLLFASGMEVMGRIDQLPELHYAWQVYGKLSIGGSRMEEKQVVEVICKEV